MKILTIFTFLILIQGCSNLSKKECSSIDWQEKGKWAAQMGVTEPKADHYQDQCTKHGIQINKEDYIKGYNAGLKDYCTFKRGFDLGLAGKKEHESCIKLSETFKDAYETGYREFKVDNKRRERAQEKLELKNKEKTDLRAHILASYPQTKECYFDNECSKDGDCTFGKCAHNGKACRFISDCEIVGECRKITQETKTYNEKVSLSLCHYKY
jgi:hypothetical protein